MLPLPRVTPSFVGGVAEPQPLEEWGGEEEVELHLGLGAVGSGEAISVGGGGHGDGEAEAMGRVAKVEPRRLLAPGAVGKWGWGGRGEGGALEAVGAGEVGRQRRRTECSGSGEAKARP